MRRSVARFLAPVAVASLFALSVPLTAAAEDTELENVETDGTQIVAAGSSDAKPSPKSLNTVPEDGLGPAVSPEPNSPMVRQLIASRPNEDLIICVAGCFSGRDRVVYAQPINSPAGTPIVAAPAPTSGAAAFKPSIVDTQPAEAGGSSTN